MAEKVFSASDSWAVGTSPTDVAMFVAGPQGATIRQINISCAAAGNVTIKFSPVIRSADDSGGTSANIESVPHSAFNPPYPAGSVLRKYTAPPTVTASTKVLRATPQTFSAGIPNAAHIEWRWNDDGEDELLKLGAGAFLGFTAAGIPNGTTIYLTVRWSEPN